MYNKNEKKTNICYAMRMHFFFKQYFLFSIFYVQPAFAHDSSGSEIFSSSARSLIRLFEIFVGDRKIPVAPTLFRYPLVQLYGVLCQRRRRVGRFGQRLAQVHVFQQQVGFETFLRVGGK